MALKVLLKITTGVHNDALTWDDRTMNCVHNILENMYTVSATCTRGKLNLNLGEYWGIDGIIL